jgi:protein-tyrosine phosphatase
MKILFVCIGNICRSPIAEGLLETKCKEKKLNWQIDSAGTHHYHVGEAPHPLSQKVCLKNGIDISNQKAREFEMEDFQQFDLIYALATDVEETLLSKTKNKIHQQKVKLILDELYPNKRRSVKDPWYGTYPDYEDVFNELNLACEAILKKYAAQ